MTDPNPPQLPDDVFPPDPDTLVGELRYLLGDINYDPDTGRYERFTDAELEAALALAEDDLARAAGYAYLKLASQAAEQAKSVKDYDLQVDLSKRATELRLVAGMWFDRADANAEDDIFDMFETGADRRGKRVPELAQWPFTLPGRW